MKTMQTTRPEFLKVAAATGVGAVLPWRRAYASAQSPSLRKFIQMLPGFGRPASPSPRAFRIWELTTSS